MTITDILKHNIHATLVSLGISEIRQSDVLLEHPADKSHGDYSANIAMILFGKLKKSGAEHFSFSSPRDLAQAIVDDLQKKLVSSESTDVGDGDASNGTNNLDFSKNISKIEIAGPGFINFTLSDAFLLTKMGLMVEKCGDVMEKVGTGKKIIAEYSSPNIAKPFTVGHLRSTIIGDSLANIFEASGYKVYRDNHLGDWGTQFGKQIYAIKTWGDEEEIENSDNPVKELVKLYVKFHEEADKNPDILDKGREWFSRLEKGDVEAKRLWKKCIDWSWKEFESIYKRLGVTFTENNGRGYGESFFEDKMDEIIQELNDKKLLKESEGAQLVFFPDDKYPPLMILKKGGSTLYSTRDLATDKFRLQKYGAETKIFNEVGSEQSLYFKQLFEIEQMLGWYKPGDRVHIGHGLIRFKDKKMSTRKGNVIWLDDVLEEAYSRVSKISENLDSETIWKIAIGALKWNDLKRKYNLSMVFDWDELTNLKGNSGPYIQYTFVRCQSIISKVQNNASKSPEAEEKIAISDAKSIEIGEKLKTEEQIATGDLNASISDHESNIAEYFDILVNLKSYLKYQPNSEEKDILRNLYRYSEIVGSATSDFAPHYIATYLYELAQSLNAFYGKHRVVDSDNSKETTEFRALLAQAVACVLKHGLNILGIETVDKM